MTTGLRRKWLAALAILLVAGTTGCQWRGLNSLPLPGTAGGGPGSFTIQAQLPNVISLQPNSRVRVGDVTVGNVTKVEMQGWHALLTMTLDGDVDLPSNATVKLGQTSLFGSLHIELAPPVDEPPNGKLHDGSLIPLSAASTYPSTEQTLAAISMVLNGGGVGQIQDITEALSTAFDGRADDLRSLINQLDEYVGYLDDQKNDILAAAESLNNLVSGRSPRRSRSSTRPSRPFQMRSKSSAISGRPSPTPCRNWVSSRRSPPTRSPKPRTPWCRSSEMSRPY
jgi:phospholipid/cholesterol/gamma-HCH transport system substrate-binding protein